MKYQLDPILEPLMGAVRHVETFLGPEDDWVEDDRRILFEAAQRHLGALHTFVYRKGPQDYLTTADCRPDEFEAAISPPYQRNLVSSRKYREHHEGGRQYAVGSFVIDPASTEWQHHVYLFESPDGKTDVYAHRETSVREGIEHLTETNQEHAAPADLFSILDRNDIEYEERQF